MEYLIFKIKDHLYGAPLDQTREVIPLTKVETVTHAPSFVEGVIMLRGHSIVAIDLKKCLYDEEKMDPPVKPGDDIKQVGDDKKQAGDDIKQAGDDIKQARNDKRTRGHVIIGVIKGMVFGFIVEEVKDVIQIQKQHIDEANQMGRQLLREPSLCGVAHVGEENIFLLDFSKILTKAQNGKIQKMEKAA